jgi:hypothetical protein
VIVFTVRVVLGIMSAGSRHSLHIAFPLAN